MVKLDIIVPNYNYGRYIQQCVESINNQNIEEYRLLIIDNASTDQSGNVIARLARADNRIKVVFHARNEGRITSLNEGINWAASEYCIFVCSDDILLPNALSKALEIMDGDRELVMAFGRDMHHSSDEAIVAKTDPVKWTIGTGQSYIEECCRKLGMCSVSPIIRTSALKQAGKYREEAGLPSDQEMMLRIACLGKVARTESSIVAQRIHGANLSNVHWGNVEGWIQSMEAAFNCFFKHEGAKLANCEELRSIVFRAFAGRAYWAGIANLLRGDWRSARNLIGYSLSRCPHYAVLPPVGALRSMEASKERIRGTLKEMVFSNWLVSKRSEAVQHKA